MSELDVLLGPRAGDALEGSDTAALGEHYAYPGTSRRAWVRANMVTSLDGAVTGGDGRSASVSSEADRTVFRVLRGLADVVLVGAGTARTEGYGPARVHPDLAAVRREQGRRETAVVVQVTRSGDVATGRGMFDEPGRGLVVLPGGDEQALARAVAAAGEDAVVVAGHVGDGGVDLGQALAHLQGLGLGRVLCEGGPALLGHLAADDLLDELCLTTSPALVAGPGDRAVTGPPVGPHAHELAGLLHADGTLLARWLRRR